MTKVLPIIQIVLAILLVLSILMQQRGTALGSSFAGEGSVYSPRRGVEKYLFYLTILLGILFIASAILGVLLQ
ncbi:preprotein translocase subunit SecG [Candidatus Berkelbacteria bacterium]|nr:preprotein translocase subunit SecG [Candidatus Berkelbacteria bacterium]